MTYLRLCYEFFMTGLFAVGGGLATLPFLKEIGLKTGWFTEGDVLDMLAISESTPGPIGVNMATYTGFKVTGVLGGVIATLALTLPSFLVAVIISGFLEKFRSSPLVDGTFKTIRPASTALIAAAGIGVAKEVFFPAGFANIVSFSSFFAAIDYKAVILAAVVTCAVIFWKKVHPIVLIAFAAVVGILWQM